MLLIVIIYNHILNLVKKLLLNIIVSFKISFEFDIYGIINSNMEADLEVNY